MTQHARSFFGRAMDCGGAEARGAMNIIPSSRLLSPSSSKYSKYGLPRRKYLILVGGGEPQDEREGIIVPSST